MRGGMNTDAQAAVPWFAPALLVATCGGVGRVPFAPGTAGSVLGVPLALVTGAAATWAACAGAAPLAVAGLEACMIAAIFLVGVPVCTRAAALLGRGKDPGCIVLDEVAAMAATLLVVPPAARTPAVLAAAFLLFRLFDIAKPFPCDRCERLPTGLGIMADDWAAAAYAATCLAAIRWLGWL